MKDCNTKNGEHNNRHRFTEYRSMIHFYILWDLDLNANHLRIYGQIEQMESNLNPNANPEFSYQWLADKMGISRRQVINLANDLKKKGYIERHMISHNKWGWRTKKVTVKQNDVELS